MDSRKKTELFTITAILLLPSILILHNLNYYKSLFFYHDTYILSVLYLTIPIVPYIVFEKLLSFSKTMSGLVTISFSIFFFFFGAIQDFLFSHRLTYYLSKTYVLLPIFLLPVIYLFLKKPEARRLLRLVELIIFFFFLTELAILFFSLNNFNEAPRVKEKIALTQERSVHSFNIYHIIFDGYTNSKTLQAEFGFTNPIDSFLRKKGFFIASDSKSNYNFTPYSLASLLHLQYLDTSGMQLERTYKNYLLGNELYHNNAVFRFFKEKGYAVQSFCILEDYKHLDKLGTFVPKTPAFSVRTQTLERIFLNPWLWQKLVGGKEGALPQNVKNSLHYYIQYNQKAFQNVLNNSSGNKVFNFTHFLLPHEPYVYKKSTVDSLTEADVMDHQLGYIMQVQYVNRLIETLVTELQKNKNNIIIIQGDHGFRDYDLSKTSALKQLEILNAFYFPDQDYSSLQDTISLINTYRVVLNKYFNQQLPLLKDQYFTPPK